MKKLLLLTLSIIAFSCNNNFNRSPPPPPPPYQILIQEGFLKEKGLKLEEVVKGDFTMYYMEGKKMKFIDFDVSPYNKETSSQREVELYFISKNLKSLKDKGEVSVSFRVNDTMGSLSFVYEGDHLKNMKYNGKNIDVEEGIGRIE